MKTQVRVFLDTPFVDESELDRALGLMPPTWDTSYINRCQKGWLFVAAEGYAYAFDDGRKGWFSDDLPDTSKEKIKAELGDRIGTVYIDRRMK